MDDLRPRVLQVLVGVLGCGPIQFVQIRHRDDPITSCLLDDLWDAVERGPPRPPRSRRAITDSERLRSGTLVIRLPFYGA